jgi:hypothetical protein
MPLLSSTIPATTAMTSPPQFSQPPGLLGPFSTLNSPGNEVISWYSNMRQPSISTILPATRTDPFNTLALELPLESKMLLDHCESKLDPTSFSCYCRHVIDRNLEKQLPTIVFCFEKAWNRNETPNCSNLLHQTLQ